MRPKVSRMSLRRGQRIRIAVRAFRIHVDQAHLHGRQRILEIARESPSSSEEHRAVLDSGSHARSASPPSHVSAPVHVLVRLPDVLAPAAETESLEAHGFERDVAREDHQVGPGNLAAVLLLDRPQQPARLVEADVVGPAVERREALLARARRRRDRRRCDRCPRCATPCG